MAEYKAYQNEYFKDLKIVQNTGDDKGGKVSWIRYHVNIKNVLLYHKPKKTDDYGTVELVFSINQDNILELKSYLEAYIGQFEKYGYELVPCGKKQISLVKYVPYLDFKKDIVNGQIAQLDQCLEAVRKMYSEVVELLPLIETMQKLKSLK